MAASNYRDYIPEASISHVDSLMLNYGIDLKIVNQRQTKHGDFRRSPSGKMQITVNNNLNPEQFIITLIHEIAHYVTFKNYGRGSATRNEMETNVSAIDATYFKSGCISRSYFTSIGKAFKESESEYRFGS